MKHILSIVCLLLVAYQQAVYAHPFVVGGYFPSWSQYSTCHPVTTKTFNPAPFTHLYYAFGAANTTSGKWEVTVGADNLPGGVLYDLVQYKVARPYLKVIVSLAGGFFYELAANQNNINTFAANLVPWLRKNNVDGIDFDWEFPTGQDAINFNTLLVAVRHAFDSERRGFNKDKLLLTIASYGDAPDLATWPIVNMTKSLDWYNVMAYEEHGAWSDDTPTGMNAPMRSNDPYNVVDAMQGYINLGVPPSKLVLGTPAFAHTWNLTNPKQHGVGAPGAGNGPAGACSQQEGYLYWFEVKQMISSGATVVWDEFSQTPYLYQGDVWVSYDDPRSMRVKADFVIENNLRGAFLWALNEDDKNELANALASEFNNWRIVDVLAVLGRIWAWFLKIKN